MTLEDAHVLIVDDNEDVLELLEELLARAGAEVSRATCVEDALRAVDEHCPDVIVTDLCMPGRDGFSLLSALRESESPFPVIAFSALSSIEDRNRIHTAGFDGFVTKPVDPDRLITVIATALAKSGSPSD